RPLPGLAPVAMQLGRHVARAILDRVAGREPSAFRYADPGSMATVGRGFAVFERGRIQVTGFLGWLGWLFIHLLQIAEFENRLLVVTQWAWSYLTRNRSARLIVRDER
ncbi:MAG: NAD(P)/FAD-dependent oxidoreductase, partial [Dehalococcoidia bacterium]